MISPEGTIEQSGVQCPKCQKRFNNAIGLRMHTLRIHSGRGWNTSANFKSKKSREKILAEKREYNRKLRARYKKEGRNSRGELMPPGWVPRTSNKWTPERRAKFNSTWRSKNKAKTKAILKKHPIQIVYPDPRETVNEGTWPENMGEVRKLDNVRKLNHCPYCGEFLVRHLNAGGWS